MINCNVLLPVKITSASARRDDALEMHLIGDAESAFKNIQTARGFVSLDQLQRNPFVIMINRTAEFASIIASLPPLPSSHAAPAHPPPSEARVSFIKAACAIDGEIR